MPKKIVQGVGMMARELSQHDVTEPGGFEAFLKALDNIVPTGKANDLPGEALDRHNAEQCRGILATAGLENLMDGKGAVDERLLIEKKLGEDSAQYLAANWLGAYNRMMAQRQRLLDGDVSPSTIGIMLMHAQDMGRLQERMWWRRGVVKIDPENKRTWVRREKLALAGKTHVEMGHKGNKMKGQKSFATVFGEEAQAKANEIAADHPDYSWSRIRIMLARHYRVSAETIKKALKNPKKVG